MLNFAAVRNYILVTVVIASVCLGIRFAVSNAQTETLHTSFSGGNHESVHTSLSERPTVEAPSEQDTGTIQVEESENLLAETPSTSISGRISTSDGVSISHGQMSLVEADGNSQVAVSDSFGYFRFAEIRTGQQVTIKSADNGRYLCTPITLQLTGISTANFTCTEADNAKAAKAPPLSPPTCVDTEITDRTRPPLDSDQQALVPIAELPNCRNSGSR